MRKAEENKIIWWMEKPSSILDKDALPIFEILLNHVLLFPKEKTRAPCTVSPSGFLGWPGTRKSRGEYQIENKHSNSPSSRRLVGCLISSNFNDSLLHSLTFPHFYQPKTWACRRRSSSRTLPSPQISSLHPYSHQVVVVYFTKYMHAITYPPCCLCIYV